MLPPTPMSKKNAIQIDTVTQYLESESMPEAGRYVFTYTVTIRNISDAPARLLTRHWVITDAHGKIQDVRGEGVVGETPHLNPGDAFRYTSAAMIETPVGTMQGEYQMLSDDGEYFDAEIPLFTLAIPRTLH
jgi:ApaG protein